MGVFTKLQIQFRLAAPRGLRKIYRVARAVIEPEKRSATLPGELLADCRLVSSREDMLGSLPRGGRVAELGTYKGEFAREILRRNEPSELHIVDVTFSYLDAAVSTDARVKCHEGFCHEVMSRFPDCYFDWIYLDADHSFEGTLRDADVCADKVKPGGFLVFNDFAHIDQSLGRYGVHRAVVEFAIRRQWPLRWFALEVFALYDVALQRPK
jgi:spermidine synthase